MTHEVMINGREGSKALKKDLIKFLTKKPQPQPEKVYFQDLDVLSREQWSGEADLMEVEQVIYCTNHPKRSWFARVTRTKNGFKVE